MQNVSEAWNVIHATQQPLNADTGPQRAEAFLFFLESLPTGTGMTLEFAAPIPRSVQNLIDNPPTGIKVTTRMLASSVSVEASINAAP
jgi:hypothetical protein